jgi:tRNA (cmo5U34)-methyltransferase
MSRAVLSRYPDAEVVLVDGAAEMIDRAREQLADVQATFVLADLREPLPEGPFDAVVSALAIHHLEHEDNRALLRRVADVLRPGGTYVNAEHVAGRTPWLEQSYRKLWREACRRAGAAEDEIAAAEDRMRMDRSTDVATQLGWMAEAGLEDCDCFFKQLHFAVLAGWRPA